MGEQIFDSTFFEHTMNNPTMTSTPLPPPTTEALPQTIKLEQLENHDTPSPSRDSYSRSSEPSQTPAPEGSSSSNGSKPVKKRKSWGQVLPEPKTSLPPRKRAKTEDEKEQRRIERVKRNRLAAHNSRERKRHEYEILQTEKDELEANMEAYKQRMAQMEAELKYFRSKYPGETPQPVFDLSSSPKDNFETICPAQTSAPFPGPISPISMDSPESPRDSSCSPETPPPVFEASPNFDSTQYSAVSVDFGNLSTGDLGLPYPRQPYAPVDEKPIDMENFFDFNQCSTTTSACMEPAFSVADSSFDVFGSSLFEHSYSTSYGSLDSFDAKFHDLQSASGATSVSDEALAAGL